MSVPVKEEGVMHGGGGGDDGVDGREPVGGGPTERERPQNDRLGGRNDF